MRLFRDPKSLASKKGYIATIGNYDGIHIGHQRILRKIKQYQKKVHLPSLVIIFEPLPAEYFLSTHAPARLTSLSEKIAIFAKYKIDNILCLRFNAVMAGMLASEFIQKILLDILNIKHLIIGDDFSFGHNRVGNFALLKKYVNQGQITEQIAAVCLPNNESQFRVSSTHIRQALANANFDLAKRFLGRSYTMSGRVVYGNGHGKVLGFPTANIRLKHKIIPLQGVYIVKIKGAGVGWLNGVVNIGIRPTIGNKDIFLEVHILDFNKNIYGKKLIVKFLCKIREERKFDSLESLRRQIVQDVTFAENFFNCCSDKKSHLS